MDNRINDKDLEFVTGGSAATPELERALELLRMAENLFTDDMPESPKERISNAVAAIERGYNNMHCYNEEIQYAISEFNAFDYENPDMHNIVSQILHYLDNVLHLLNH